MEAIGDISYSKDDTKCATNKISIVKKLSWYEVLNLVNTGIGNTGIRNTGNCNTGIDNTGDYNLKHYNSGHYNTGSHNSGDFNSGNYNAGSYNSGSYNTGDYNSGDYNTRCFNTKDKKIRMFNKESNWTYSDWADSDVRYILKEMPTEYLERQDWYNNLCSFHQNSIKSLPNFDADIFFEITGIKV